MTWRKTTRSCAGTRQRTPLYTPAHRTEWRVVALTNSSFVVFLIAAVYVNVFVAKLGRVVPVFESEATSDSAASAQSAEGSRLSCTMYEAATRPLGAVTRTATVEGPIWGVNAHERSSRRWLVISCGKEIVPSRSAG